MSILTQHNEESFQLYEPYIAQAIENFPNPTIFQPTTPSTFVARMRDALNGMRLNKWESQRFTIEAAATVFRLLRGGGTFIFTPQPSGIYCGPPIRDNGAVIVTQGSLIQGLEHGEYDARDEALFDALFTLKERGLLSQPLTFRNMSDVQQQRIEQDQFMELIEQGGANILI